MSYAYQPAHEAHLTKHNNQMFEFDSPATIAKQQQQHQQFQQAGGAPSIGSAPAPPPLPQLGFKNSRPLGLRTRDWGNKPWNGQANAYVPPPSLLKNNSASSLNKFPASGYQSGAQSGIQPALQSAMQSGLQSGHSGLPATNYSPSSTIPLSHNFHLPSSQLSQSAIPTQSAIPNGNLSLNKGSSIPIDSNLSLNKGSSIPLDSNLSLNKGSAIPLDSNLSLNKGSSIPSGNLSLNKDSSILGGNNLSLGQNSSIPNAPAWTGYRHGSWRANRNKPNLRLRTKNWGSRSKKGWSGYNSRSVLDEGFLRNRPQAAPMAPPIKALLFGQQRKWKSGPYRMRPLRTRNWGPRNEDGWSHFNRGIFMHESALPFMANRQKWADTADLSRDIPQQSNLSAPIQQSNFSAPIQQSNFSAPIQQSNFSAPIQQSFSSAPISAPIISAAPIAAPLAAAPLVAPVAPLTGRKGKRAARKLRKQQAIQAKLTSELTPPVGDPAVNHYRRGAKATVPLAGPAVGLANPTGSIASRRTGRRNNLGRRRNRLAAPALPVPATQPPVVGLAPVAPLSSARPLSSAPLSAPLSATSASFIPINSAPLSSSYGSSQTIAPSFARSAGIPLNTQQSSSLYSSAAQQSRPLSSTFAQPIVGSNKPLYSAHEPVAAQIMEKQQPIIQNRPIGSATF